MKRFSMFGALLALTLITSGCSAFGQVVSILKPSGTIASVAPAAMNAAKKGLTAAHLTHEAAADALTIAANAGLLHGTNAATAKKWLDDSEVYLKAADKLVALGDAPGIEAKIGAANALVAQIQKAVGTP